MMQKLVGTRVYWNGTNFYLQSGKEVVVPSFFLEGLPDLPLDGQLCSGLEKIEHIVKSKTETWEKIKFLIFDLPASNEIYENRIRTLQKLSLPAHVQVVQPQQCDGYSHLEDYLELTLQTGGQAVILTEPKSLYAPHRSPSLLIVEVNCFKSP